MQKNKIIILFAFFALCLPNQIFAATLTDQISGVYKHRFQNALVTGETYPSEDILEIVPYGSTAAYLRYALNFYNGHSCSLAGIAEDKGDHLTFTDPNSDTNCVLDIRIKGDALVSNDVSSPAESKFGCHYYCGARGGFNHVTFPLKSKRKIRYMKRILDSSEYKDAVQGYDKLKDNTPIDQIPKTNNKK